MTCETCQSWSSFTEAQWKHRVKQIKMYPGIGLHRCPKCHSDEWATTREHITIVREPKDSLKSIRFWGNVIIVCIFAIVLVNILFK